MDLPMAKAPALSGMFFFQTTGVPAFFSSDWHRTASNASMQGFQGLLVAAVLQGIVNNSSGRVHGFAERQGDADAFRFSFLDIVEPVFQGTIEVSEYLRMADVKILTETGQGLISGHDGLLSGAERKKGTARFLDHPLFTF
jgi:hypothetical protein